MKVDWNKKYNTIAAYSVIVVFISIVLYQILSNVEVFKGKLSVSLKVFHPFIIGFIMAYLFNFILKFYEKKILKTKITGKGGKTEKKNRAIGMLLTYITIFVIFFLLMNFVFPQLFESISGLVNDIPKLVDNASKLIIKIDQKWNINSQYHDLILEKWNNSINHIIKFGTNLLPILAYSLKNVISSVWNLVIGLIISIYLLIEKEKFFAMGKKITKAIFSTKASDKILEVTGLSNEVFGKFLSGKILDSTIIGILTFVILTVTKMPYTILISFIIGITNIIPFFGPFIGAIPAFFIILFVSPVKALWFILIILIIQQIDGNIIGPKILGDSLGISAFWILFALLVSGKLFGFIGLIIGVPLFVIIYTIVKEILDKKACQQRSSFQTGRLYVNINIKIEIEPRFNLYFPINTPSIPSISLNLTFTISSLDVGKFLPIKSGLIGSSLWPLSTRTAN